MSWAADIRTIVPADRVIEWRPGLPDGIPKRQNVCAEIFPGDFARDRITAAIEKCPAGGVILLKEGSFNLGTETLDIKKGITLRGQGPQKTKLYFAGTGVAIKMGNPSPGAIVDMEGTHLKGSRKIKLKGNSSIQAGDFVVVHQNSPPIVDPFQCSYCCEDRSSTRGYQAGTRCISQIIPVESRPDSQTLELKRPLYFDYQEEFDPEVYRWNMVKQVGLEDLYIERTNTGGDAMSDIIRLYGCAHCWVSNVETFRGQGAHVRNWFSYGNEIRDSFFNMGHNSMSGFGYNSGRNYGLLTWMANSDHLYENNIINSSRHAMIFEGGGSGVVYGYNYALNGLVYNDPTWVTGDASMHGAHPHMNLFEGNINERLSWDYTHGSSSHNMAFRNHIYRDSPGKTGGQRSVDLMRANTFATIVGNVLCIQGCGGGYEVQAGVRNAIYRFGYRSDGDGDHNNVDPRVKETLLRTGNYDYLSQQVRWDHGENRVFPFSNELPASLYRANIPAWASGFPWPLIGPDVVGYVNAIPAKVCYEKFASQGRFDANQCYSVSAPPPKYDDDADERSGFGAFQNVFSPLKGESLDILLSAPPGAFAKLSVVDRRGNTIRTLFEGTVGLVPNVAWDGNNGKGAIVSAGVYILMLKIDGNTTTRKVIVLK
jgi:hypothetical protein